MPPIDISKCPFAIADKADSGRLLEYFEKAAKYSCKSKFVEAAVAEVAVLFMSFVSLILLVAPVAGSVPRRLFERRSVIVFVHRDRVSPLRLKSDQGVCRAYEER